jgi:CubicO group peptidase (beta-lactamase class C family)
MDFEKIWNDWSDSDMFSGVILVSREQEVIFEKICGYRNRSESLLNNKDTAFSIASGTKMFTGLAICKLIDDKMLTLNDKLCNILSWDLGLIDKRVTINHLLTHTSGVGDYIDEESEDSMEQLQALYNKYPVYLWERLEYYIPMIKNLPPKFEPGTRYGYSNSGFVLLGLVVEAISGISYQKFVTDNIITPNKLAHTGFYRMDSLPTNTAFGYMKDDVTGEWRTNIYYMPIIGGSDGGLYTCANDLQKIWRAIFSNEILSDVMTRAFLKSQVLMSEDDDEESYGLGVYIHNSQDLSFFYAVGGDYGVDFFTAFFPNEGVTVSALGNTEIDTFPLLEAIASALNTAV